MAQSLAIRLLRLPLSVIADAIGCDETGACRVRANERACTISAWLRLTDAAGYKLVDKSKLCVPADELRMLRRIYSEVTARELIFDDPE